MMIIFSWDNELLLERPELEIDINLNKLRKLFQIATELWNKIQFSRKKGISPSDQTTIHEELYL